MAPRVFNQATRWCASLRAAASIGVRSSWPIQLTSAPRSRRYSAVWRCPPWQAHQKALVISSCVGCAAAVASSRTRGISPVAAACQRFALAPRSSSRRAAFHCPKATASGSAVPPSMTEPLASRSAPASSSASRTSTSSLLAAQCSGVSPWTPANLALTSAPAAMSRRTALMALGKWPGQSVAICSSERDCSPQAPRRVIVELAISGCSASRRSSSSRFPDWIAPVIAMASGSSARSVSICGGPAIAHAPSDGAGRRSGSASQRLWCKPPAVARRGAMWFRGGLSPVGSASCLPSARHRDRCYSGCLWPSRLVLDRLGDGDVVSVGVLDAELAKTAGGVVERVVDRRVAALDLLVDRFDVVDADERVPDVGDDPPVRDDPLGVFAERHQDGHLVAVGDDEIGWVAVDLAGEPEPVAVVRNRALDLGDEQDCGAS